MRRKQWVVLLIDEEDEPEAVYGPVDSIDEAYNKIAAKVSRRANDWYPLPFYAVEDLLREAVVLNDGETYTYREGSVILTIPADIDDDDIDEYVKQHAHEGRPV
jgi:hypothetical protein